jgi:mono/diheme cytochrome c family protein
MLQFGWMKDPAAAAVLTYVRSHFGNSSPPLDAAAVAAARP